MAPDRDPHAHDTARSEEGLAPPGRPAGVGTEEADAVRVALTGRTWDRVKIAGRALSRLLRDPNDTRQVFVLYVSLNARAFPRVLERFAREPDGPSLLADKPALDSTTLDFLALLALPEDTLGHAFARHMRDNGLSPDIFQPPPGAPPEVAYLAQRLRQTHDLWHVVTGYGTDVTDELALQAFTYAQFRAPGPLILSTAGAIRFGLADKNVPRRVWDGFQRGRRARSLLAVRWEDLWATPLAEVRRQLAIAPAPPSRMPRA